MNKVAKNKLSYEGVLDFVETIFGGTMHAKRVGSLADAAFGLLQSERMLLHKMGAGLALGKTLNKKHATKQIDRLLSNPKFDIWGQAEQWLEYMIGGRKELLFSMDWTDFDGDSQSTIAINLITSHGRATPVLWKTVNKSSLKNNRARYEDQILSQLQKVIPKKIKVTILADRGFADQKFFEFIEKELLFSYIIRIRSNTYIYDEKGEARLAKGWLKENGHTRCLKNVGVTKTQYHTARFVCAKQKNMKDAWFIVSNRHDLNGTQLMKLYGKRWTIETYFRDLKDQRFGWGFQETHISTPKRRDRLLFISSICTILLTLLGAAGEQIGFDKKLKVNTVKTRTHSLLTQGIFYQKAFPNFSPQEQSQLMREFNGLLMQKKQWKKLFFVV